MAPNADGSETREEAIRRINSTRAAPNPEKLAATAAEARRRLIVLAAVGACVLMFIVVAAIASSGGDSSSSPRDVSSEPFPGADTEAAPDQFTGVDASNYQTAYGVCSGLGATELARQYGIASTEPADVAQVFSEDWTQAYRQPVFEGCLDALLGDPADPTRGPNP